MLQKGSHILFLIHLCIWKKAPFSLNISTHEIQIYIRVAVKADLFDFFFCYFSSLNKTKKKQQKPSLIVSCMKKMKKLSLGNLCFFYQNQPQ